MSSARNKGLDIAEGKYIGFVDSDDYIDKRMYELLYRYILKFNSQIAICNFTKCYNDEMDLIELDSNTVLKNYSNEEALQELCINNTIQFVVPWNKLYEKSLFNNLRYPEGVIHEDEFLAHKLLYGSRKVVVISNALYIYYINENSIMTKKFNINRFCGLYSYMDRIDYVKKVKGKNSPLVRNIELHLIISLFEYYKKSNSITEIREEGLKICKKILFDNLGSLLKNPLFNYKEKLLWILFCINDNLYMKYIKSKEVFQSGTDNINN